MYEKPCNLARAAKCFKGGGGGGDIDVPSYRQVLGDVTSSFPSVARTYRNFANSEPYLQWQQPILQQLSDYAPDAARQFYNEPGQLLSDASNIRSQFADQPAEMLQSAQDFGSQFEGLPDQIMQDASGLRSQFAETPGQYLNVMQGLLPIAQTGELTQDQRNEAIQQARSGAQARGDIGSNSAIFAEAMNRRKYADARQQQAITEALSLGQGALGIASGRDEAAAGLDQAAQGLGLQRAQGVQGLQQGALNYAAGRDAAAMGLTQGAQGVAQGTEQLLGYPSQQLTQAELGRTGAFASLMNPLYGLAGQQLQAQTAGQVAAQGSSDQGKSNTMNSIVGIVGAAATAY